MRASGKQNSLFPLRSVIKCLILGIKIDDECLYCGDKDSIEHTFIECPFTKSFVKKVIEWFNEANCKFNYTSLSMRYYIYSNKVNSKGIYMHEFINKLSLKYNLENIN